MIERLHLFGKEHRLVGITTEPAAECRRSQAPAFLLLNAGILHRIGPFRLYVDLARLLAENGFTAMRFDISGIGDSLLGNDSREDFARALSNCAEAMDLLEAKMGIRRFVVFGLCWGGDLSHTAAVFDKRIDGAVMIDTYGYPTFQFFLNDRVLPLLKAKKWIGYFKKMWRALRSKAAAFPTRRLSVFSRQFPPREKTAREVQQLIERGARLLYIYSGGVPVYYNYGRQFWDMFKGIDFKGRVEVSYFKEADHLFSGIEVRTKMIAEIINWMKKL